MTPTAPRLLAFRWQCKFCHKHFQSTRPDFPGLCDAPPVMICNDCADAYDAKVMANYKLPEEQEQAARSLGRNKSHDERRELLAHWQHLHDAATRAVDKAYWQAMMAALRTSGTGLDDAGGQPGTNWRRRK